MTVVRITPYLRNNMSTLLVLSAIAVLLTTIPPVLSNFLQPVQAQTSLSFRTTNPASGSDPNCISGDAALTFHARGTTTSSNPQRVDITSGTFKVAAMDDEQESYGGNLLSGSFTSNSDGGVDKFALSGTIDNVSNTTNCSSIQGATFSIGAPCSTSNSVTINTHYLAEAPVFNNFNGVVECSQGGDDTSTQSSSSSSTSVTVTTTQDDKDGDGILDANDNCPNLPNTKCYKEGDSALVVHRNR